MNTNQNMSIVVVDDDKCIRSLLVDALGILGYEVVDTGCDGVEAVELYSKHQPDLLICDGQMPRMNGIDAARCILNKNPEAKVLFVSGTLTEDDLLPDEKAHFRVLSKPFHIADLKTELEIFQFRISLLEHVRR
ncbi:MAG: response regulator [Verrucomicrobiota bacterium]|nr:response regulator [Verrucomicrobiota bacterium]